jgi:hypothetical protein
VKAHDPPAGTASTGETPSEEQGTQAIFGRATSGANFECLRTTAQQIAGPRRQERCFTGPSHNHKISLSNRDWTECKGAKAGEHLETLASAVGPNSPANSSVRLNCMIALQRTFDRDEARRFRDQPLREHPDRNNLPPLIAIGFRQISVPFQLQYENNTILSRIFQEWRGQ